MYITRPNIIIGFHGCDEKVRDNIVSGRDILKHSTNDYDWLGNGAYFWEYNEKRALQYAELIRDHPERCSTKIEKPAVLGAVIQLGYCLDLLDSTNLDILRETFYAYKEINDSNNDPMPANKASEKEGDLLIRKLDCAVIQHLHKINHTLKEPEYDSVRGVFFEGKDLYPNAGFKEKNHIQICVINPNCIKGFFVPRKINSTFIRI